MKTILITGATDGIGLETAKMLGAAGHALLLHGRSKAKLDAAADAVRASGAEVSTYLADMSRMGDVAAMADAIAQNHPTVDVVINNAGVLKAPVTTTQEGLDIRFVVNTLAPYLLAKRLLPILSPDGRIVNLSSAAQAPVSIDALNGQKRLNDMDAYSQSKLALTIWSQELAKELIAGQVCVAVNPGSLLASKMVKEGFGVAGNDLSVGVDILMQAALSEAFADANGRYFDNDSGRFAAPHRAAADAAANSRLMTAMDALLEKLLA